MMTATKDQYQQAAAKAAHLGGASLVRAIDPESRWMVQGSNAIYTVVRAWDGDLVCSCPAGRNGRACYHFQAVGLWLAVQRPVVAVTDDLSRARAIVEQTAQRIRRDPHSASAALFATDEADDFNAAMLAL